MRVLVTGSRNWPLEWQIHRDLTELLEQATAAGEPFTVVHGACGTGADHMVNTWAIRNPGRGIVVERHPADWRQHGRKAGPLRNAHMVSLGADVCLAYLMPCTDPKCRRPKPHDSHGASGCAELAERAGIETRRNYREDPW